MKKELIPIIAAYWGAECSSLNGWEKPERVFVELNENSFHTIIKPSFKLHLRPLFSITEQELRELGEVIGISTPSIFTDGIDEFWRVVPAKQLFNDINDPYFMVYEDNSFDLGEWKEYSKVINSLRSKGFCVDKELVDAGLVEWKEVEL